jgi:hypothetical protein
MDFSLESFEGAVSARVVAFEGRSGAGVCGSLLSLLEVLLVESLIVGDVVRFGMWCGVVDGGIIKWCALSWGNERECRQRNVRWRSLVVGVM